MNTQKTNIKNEYLEQFLNVLKDEYPESEYEYEINLELGFIEIKGRDIEIYIELNQYEVPISVSMTKIDEAGEIIIPEACHDCFEFCPYYDAQNEECLRTDDKIDEEIAEWQKTLFESDYITIARTIAEKRCYLDMPHYHYFQAYTITIRKGLTASDIMALEQLFDLFIHIVEK